MNCAWDICEVAWPADLSAAAATFGAGEELAWLDSTADVVAHPRGARSSLLCARPVACLEQIEGRAATFSVGGVQVADDESGWRLWRQAVAPLSRLPGNSLSLVPGWVGYLGFELAGQLERLPATHTEDLGLPLMRLALFDRGIVLDHRRQQAFAVYAPSVRVQIGLTADPGDADWLERWEHAAIARNRSVDLAPPVLHFEIDQETHERAVCRALEYIAAGDIYQVNIAQRLRLAAVQDVLGAYAALRQVNPAPYAALLQWEDGAVAAVSPELFLRLRGAELLTRPIKGTRPRTGDPIADEQHRRELLGSAKEAAELTMIVDLHRNDLGRVCRFGSVRVTHPRRIEAHPSVYHTVADVVGRLAPGRDAIDALAACFPAGSISGVPKIRAIEIIDELEPVARGAYTGAIGVLGLDGQMTFNVAIRTLQIFQQAATLYVGGGIVADSDPSAEYEETLAKARGILAGLGVPSHALPAAEPAGQSGIVGGRTCCGTGLV